MINFYKYYRISYRGLICVARRRVFSGTYLLDFGISCKKHELKIESRVYQPFCSKELRKSSFNKLEQK